MNKNTPQSLPAFTIEVVDEGNDVVYIFDSEASFQEWDLYKKPSYIAKRAIEQSDLDISL